MIVQLVMLERGATGVCRSLIQTAESPGGACWSSTRSATSWSLRPDWCRDVEAAALACEVRATTNIPCNLASIATSMVTALQPLLEMASSASSRVDREVAPEHRAEALDVLQEHRLALPVGADHMVVIAHRQLDDRVEPRERPVAGKHLLDGDPRMPRAEDMHQPAGQDGRRESLGGLAND